MADGGYSKGTGKIQRRRRRVARRPGPSPSPSKTDPGGRVEKRHTRANGNHRHQSFRSSVNLDLSGSMSSCMSTLLTTRTS